MANSTTTVKDLLTTKDWIQDATNAARQSSETEIVVDMSSVERICSQDLNQLIELQRQLTAQGRKLVLENMLDHVTQVFLITRLDRVLEVREQVLA